MVTREAAHRQLTAYAHELRRLGSTVSLADAFRLACLRHPDLADLLATGIEERSGRDLTGDYHVSNRRDDDVGSKVRDYARGQNGKTDPLRLRRLAEANKVWLDRYAALNLGGQMAAILGRLRPKVAKGTTIAFP